MATKAIKKSTKKSAPKADFSKSVKSIKSTAKTVNNQLMETAEDLMEDIKGTASVMKEVTEKTVKGAMDKVNIDISADKIKKTAKKIDTAALNTAEDLIDAAIASGEQWQGIASKAIKGGMKLSSKQQEIVFNALESMKDQVNDGVGRFKKLFTVKA